MGIKLSPEQLQLYKAIDEILWNNWDPIGLKPLGDWPDDEYKMYLPIIFSLKNEGASTKTVASKLYEIETQRMGLAGWHERCKKVAEKIFNLNY